MTELSGNGIIASWNNGIPFIAEYLGLIVGGNLSSVM